MQTVPEARVIHTLFQSHQWVAAEAAARNFVQQHPDTAFGWKALGAVLTETRRFPEAVECLKKALTLDPRDADSYSNLGHILGLDGQLPLAIACVRQALGINPHFAEGYNNLGELYRKAGRFQDALTCYRKVLELRPDFTQAYSNKLFCQLYIAPEALRKDAEAYGKQLSAQATPYTHWNCTPNKPLYVGLVSGDLRSHAVSTFIRSVIPHINRDRIRLIAFFTKSKNDEDKVTEELKPFFSEWYSLYGMQDKEASALIHNTCVHICVDMSGHSDGNRIPLFAWRPAPVQIGWCSYATSGLSAIDALIADEYSVPKDAEAHFTESIWRLPIRLCFTAPPAIPIEPLPALKKGYMTFGCFQTIEKIRPPLLKMWAALFHTLPTAHLRIQNTALQHESIRKAFLTALQKLDMDVSRITLVGPMSREKYLQAYNEVDCCLDTFPYTGCTTTCEALWMGVPTLTLAGNTLLSRQGVSIMQSAGLGEWIAQTPEEYITKAVALNTQRTYLEKMRKELRVKVTSSKVMDAKAYAYHFEQTLTAIWEQYSVGRI